MRKILAAVHAGVAASIVQGSHSADRTSGGQGRSQVHDFHLGRHLEAFAADVHHAHSVLGEAGLEPECCQPDCRARI